MGTVLVIISFATIIVLLRKRHLSVLPAGECRHKMTWRIPVPLSFLACRDIVRRFLVRLCKSNNIFLNCQIIWTKNDHERSAMSLRLRRTVTGEITGEKHLTSYLNLPECLSIKAFPSGRCFANTYLAETPVHKGIFEDLGRRLGVFWKFSHSPAPTPHPSEFPPWELPV